MYLTTRVTLYNLNTINTCLVVHDLAGGAVSAESALWTADQQLVVAEPLLELGPLLGLGVDGPPLLEVLLPVVVVVVAL